MAPISTMFNNKPKKPLTKSISLDHFGRESCPTSEDEDIGGGAPLTIGRGSIFSTPTAQRPASSGMAEQLAPSSKFAFQVWNSQDDDVFTEKVNIREKEFDDVGDDASFTEENILPVDSEESTENFIPLSQMHIDAQNIYPPTACLFAANLPAAFDDDKLEVEITRHLSQFGSVFVKIRRDNRQMPFAFCQFTCDADARRAEKHGSGARILGRPIRLEMAKAHATWIVYKVSGKATTKQEATSLLGTMGEISRATPLDEQMRAALRLPPAIVVQFKMYDPKRDIEKRFGNHHIFRVRAFEPKAADPQPENHRSTDNDAMLQYDRDRRSAYFGNLPPTATDSMLRRLASAWGQVVDVDLKRKHVPAGPNRSIEICFAFVEFMRPDSVDDVAAAFNSMKLEGYTVRVERKQSHFIDKPHRNAPNRPQIQSRSGAQTRSQVQSWRSTMQGRHTRDAPSNQQSFYSRSFSTSCVNNQGESSPSSTSPSIANHHENTTSDLHSDQVYHPSIRHVSSMNPMMPMRPALTGGRDTPPFSTTDTPKAVKFEGLHDRRVDCDKSKYGGMKAMVGDDHADGQRDGQTIPESPAIAASLGRSAIETVPTSPTGYSIMAPPLSPYGYSNVNHPMMHTPMTPQGPVFYNNGFPGYGYSPMPTPMEAYFYHQHLAMLAASYQDVESPTRLAGPMTGDENESKSAHPTENPFANDQSIKDEPVKDDLVRDTDKQASPTAKSGKHARDGKPQAQ